MSNPLTGGQNRIRQRGKAETTNNSDQLYRRDNQLHGVVTHVIDREGKWRGNFHGLKFDPANLVLFVNALVNDVDRPGRRGDQSLWDRVRRLF